MESALFTAAACALVPTVIIIARYGESLAEVAPATCNEFLDSYFMPQPLMIEPHLACMGPAGRSIYLDMYKVDLIIFPLVYTLVLHGVLKRVWSTTSRLAMVPFLACAADVSENCGIIHLLRHFPAHNDRLAMVIATCTRIKWAVVLVSLILVLMGAVKQLVRVPSRQKQKVT
ncbi:TPA: hypothetical protein N0F65_001734 [Lagenidium giganteum]|uniref:Uncharacterized protein n=1 Tax=Lagenidium giganteum TaxID=4803 RepID=A0AAV2Z199_9STRA|nr:TPA: hypothetical protein N0F65_001734 [Lagenidium giganteum]